MAEITSVKGHDGSDWNIDVGASDKIGLCGTNFGNKLSVGGWQKSTHRTDSDMSDDLCVTNHMRNCRYVSKTQVSLMEAAAVDLIAANVGQNDCSARISYQDEAGNTVLENCELFFYNGTDPAVAPVGIKAVAFERTATDIRKNRIGGDTDGKAWDSDYGVCGNANALSCADQASSSIHNFYAGFSLSPTTSGLKTALRMRLEFDKS